MNGNQSKDAPLAWSQAGDPIELPEAASLWRVRRLNGKGGAPELVYDGDGLPLVVDISIGAADLADAVRQPGKYRLDALDDHRKAIQGVPPAYVMVGGGARPEAPSSPGQGDIALKTLADVFVRQSAQVSSLIEACTKLVAAVDAAGVSRREPPPPEPALRNGAERDEDEDDDEDEDQEAEDDGDGEDEDAAKKDAAPDLFDRAITFCATVPPENLRVIGEMAPDLIANGIEKVVSKGLGGIVAKALKPADEGGES